MIDHNSLVSAVIAARNEEPTVGAVVRTLVASGLFRDVILVSDGSTDRTAEEGRRAGATQVHTLPVNRGKGAALAYGVRRTSAPILFFCDADLLGLRVEHVQRLIEPVRAGKLAMCAGLRDRGMIITWLSRWLPRISGERALLREIFESLPEQFVQGFMVEVALNVYCKTHGLGFDVRPLSGLRIRRKFQKVGWWQGGREYVRMARQIMWAYVVMRF